MADFVKVINGKITQNYSSRKQYVDDNGVRYPVSIWQNTNYLKTQNLCKIQEGVMPNQMYYIISGSTLSYDSVADTVNRSYTSTEKSTDSLKEYFINDNLSSLKLNLESTNYHIIRSQEDTKYTVASAVSTWRTKIYSEFDSHVTSINACKKITDFEALDLRFTTKPEDRKSTRLNSSHLVISYAVFCLKKKNKNKETHSAYKT